MTAAPNDMPSLSVQCYRWLFEISPQPQCVYDASNLRILAANAAAAVHFGHSSADLIGMELPQLYHADDIASLCLHLQKPLGPDPDLGVWHHRLGNGEFCSVETTTQEFMCDGVRLHLLIVSGKTKSAPASASQLPSQEVNELLEGIPHAFFTLDHEWCFAYVNAHAEKILHRPLHALLGRNIWEVFPDAKDSAFYAEYQKILAGGAVGRFEAYYSPKDVWRDVDVRRTSSGFAVHYRDSTEKHRDHDQLRKERDTLAALVNASANAILTVGSDGVIQSANPGAERVFGHAAQSMVGLRVETLMPERFRASHPKQHDDFLASDATSRKMGLGIIKGLAASGDEIDLEGTITKVSAGPNPLTMVSLRDVTARTRVDAEVQRSRQQLSELTHRLMTQERLLVRNIAQSLHDQLGQTIAAIRMAHETMVAQSSSAASPALARLQSQQSALIGQAMRQVRQVLTDLRPTLLEEQGLAAALDNELRNRAQIMPTIDFSLDVIPPADTTRWPVNVEYAAFMVAREAVENVMRHSGSPSVFLVLSGDTKWLELEILDKGSGMPDAMDVQDGHLGILGMYERARAIGATVTVHPNIPSGTRVQLHWEASP